MTKKKLHEAYQTMVHIEEDCTKAINIAKELKKGILFNTLSDERKKQMCDQIIEVLEK